MKPIVLDTYKARRRFFEKLEIPLPAEYDGRDEIEVVMGSWLDLEIKKKLARDQHIAVAISEVMPAP